MRNTKLNKKHTFSKQQGGKKASTRSYLVDWFLDRIDSEKEVQQKNIREDANDGTSVPELEISVDATKRKLSPHSPADALSYPNLLISINEGDPSERDRAFSIISFLKKKFFSGRCLALYVSLAFHLILVIILASIFFSMKVGILGNSLVAGFSDITDLDFVDVVGDSLDSTTDVMSQVDVEELSTEIENDLLEKQETENVNETIENLNVAEAGENVPTDSTDALIGTAYGAGIPFYSKTGATGGRKRDTSKYGRKGRMGDVTNESEDAVERGLDWLARHQLSDGSWSFDLKWKNKDEKISICNGEECSNSTSTSGGTLYLKKLHPSQTAATALALLPFLGAGYTHTEEGKFQKTIAMGLRFIEYRSVTTEYGVDFRDGFTGDGAAYIQALCALVCCEAYEMTHDQNLKNYAEGGIRFIENSQLADGAWRYNSIGDPIFSEKIAGDTSVLGWQMLALKSGISAGFTVRASVAYKVADYLDSVSVNNGRFYRYQLSTSEGNDKMWGTTAVGALTREYLGWGPGVAELDVCIKQIARWIDKADSIWKDVKKGEKKGSTKTKSLSYFREGRLVYNLYFAYYASLALHHYGGNVWSEHFAKIRDLLVETQSRGGVLGAGCERGSWLFYDTYMNDGGRLLNTSLAILILETPYRYLPMYR